MVAAVVGLEVEMVLSDDVACAFVVEACHAEASFGLDALDHLGPSYVVEAAVD